MKFLVKFINIYNSLKINDLLYLFVSGQLYYKRDKTA